MSYGRPTRSLLVGQIPQRHPPPPDSRGSVWTVSCGHRPGRAHAAVRLQLPAIHLLKTFIVEDSPVIRDNLIATLEVLTSVKVVGTAEDEAGAIAALGQADGRFDLVIVDIFLKGGSGLGVLRRMDGLQRGAKRVVLSNYATPDMRRKCLELGADMVFDKSDEIDALIQYCIRLADDPHMIEAV